MTVLEDQLAEYLQVRRQLGSKLDGYLLADFVAAMLPRQVTGAAVRHGDKAWSGCDARRVTRYFAFVPAAHGRVMAMASPVDHVAGRWTLRCGR